MCPDNIISDDIETNVVYHHSNNYCSDNEKSESTATSNQLPWWSLMGTYVTVDDGK